MEHYNLDYFRDSELIGKRVRVKWCDKYKRYNVKGCYGTIKACYSYVAVRLDGLHNESSATGWFYFYKKHLEIIENENTEETTMTTNVNPINNYLNIAKMRFMDSAADVAFDYANYIPDLKDGDLCVVMTARRGMSVAKVVEIIDQNDVPLTGEIVAKIDTTNYNTRVETRKKAAELKQKMQERARKLQDVALYQMLAKDDSEMAALLSEFTALGGV